MTNIAVIGAGSMGTAVAVLLASNGHQVKIWDRKPELLSAMEEKRENSRYLPDVIIPQSVEFYADAADAVKGADAVVFSVPSQAFGAVFKGLAPGISDDAVIINTAKGIDGSNLQRMSEAAEKIKPGVRFCVLSGPSHAEEIGRLMPTMVVAASEQEETAVYVQDLFMNGAFRVYTNHDVTGVELGGALKNIMALAGGICDGLGYGDNAKAGIMTRGIAEMTRLGLRMGAEASTLAGLAGVGDLIVTCYSMHSRNRRCGILMGRGMSSDEAVKQVGMVVEGIFAAKCAQKLAEKYAVDMPITAAVCAVVDGEKGAKEAFEELMNRSRKHETSDLKA